MRTELDPNFRPWQDPEISEAIFQEYFDTVLEIIYLVAPIELSQDERGKAYQYLIDTLNSNYELKKTGHKTGKVDLYTGYPPSEAMLRFFDDYGIDLKLLEGFRNAIGTEISIDRDTSLQQFIVKTILERRGSLELN